MEATSITDALRREKKVAVADVRIRKPPPVKEVVELVSAIGFEAGELDEEVEYYE